MATLVEVRPPIKQIDRFRGPLIDFSILSFESSQHTELSTEEFRVLSFSQSLTPFSLYENFCKARDRI